MIGAMPRPGSDPVSGNRRCATSVRSRPLSPEEALEHICEIHGEDASKSRRNDARCRSPRLVPGSASEGVSQ